LKNIGALNSTLINNQRVKEKIIREIRILWDGEKEDKSYQSLWNIAKIVIRGKFIAINAYIKEEWFKINNVTFQPKNKTKKWTKHKASMKKEIQRTEQK